MWLLATLSLSPLQKYKQGPTDVSAVRAPALTTRHAVLIFHGAGGPDRETDDLRERVARQDRAADIERDVVVFDWRRWLGSSDRAAFDGQAIGQAVGAQLATASLDSLHVIGTSVGGFAADACVSGFVEASGASRCRTHLTLTDPFTSRGDLTEGWGLANFGRSADFAEHILNTDDFVPTTNEPPMTKM